MQKQCVEVLDYGFSLYTITSVVFQILIAQNSTTIDYQQTLEKNILKINYKSFCQVVILGSAAFTSFMQLPAAQRREIIEDLLDLEIFSIMNVLLKQKFIENNELLIQNRFQSELRLFRWILLNRLNNCQK